jgi:anthranilate synthase
LKPAVYHSASGIVIDRSLRELTPDSALRHVRQGIRNHVGALYASGYEYPGRYSRWDIGFFNPPIEILSIGRCVHFHARNDKGLLLLDWIETIFKSHPHIQGATRHKDTWIADLKPMDPFFPEEDRSRQPSLFTLLRHLIQQLGSSEDQHLGLYGAFGYDLVFQFDPITFKHSREDQCEAKIYLPDEIIVVDRRLEKAYALSYEFSKGEFSTVGLSRQSPLCSDIHAKAGQPSPAPAQGNYAQKVKVVQEGCRRGDYFEVVLSRTIQAPFQGNAMDVFHRIQKRNPSPYEFIVQLESEQLVGASPEMFVRVEGRRVETCPISGTIARGESPLEDADQIRALLSSDKEEAELTMCTDVDRNDKSRVCKPETVKVLGRRLIELYSKVIHTVDHVEGELRDDMDGLDAFLSHMWAVTLSGSPKKAAMQAIEDLEDSPRGWYGGAVGALLFNGDINTGITIRTVRIKDGIAHIRVGATLLAASDPDSEERETEIKAEAFVKAVTEPEIALAEPSYNATHGRGKKVLFVDHQDSFVHTLAGYVRRTGAEVLTLRSGFPMAYLEKFNPDLVFLSPGPFSPSYFGLPDLILELMKRRLPMFGVCLGLQGMVEALGGELGVLNIPQHGVHAMISHENTSVFQDLPQPMKASRYHSLYAIESKLPADFLITARSADNVIMGIQHKSYPMAAVQFHPESIHALRKDAGLHLIDNALKILTPPRK